MNQKIPEPARQAPPAEVKALIALYNEQRFAEVENQAQRLIGQYPDAAILWKLLGATLQMQGRDALPAFGKAAELMPGDAEIRLNMGITLQERGQFDEAAENYRQALQLNPGIAEAHYNLGNVMVEMEQLEAAVTCYRNALSINPNLAMVYGNLGGVLQDLGRIDEALEVCRKALTVDPDSPVFLGNLHSLLTQSKTIDIHSYITELKSAIAQEISHGANNANHKLIPLYFALGKSYDDTGDYDQALMNFSEGCKLKRSTLNYDENLTSRLFDDIIRVFDRTTMKRLKGCGIDSDLPIFVLGMPRSGTSLIEQILASHPDIHGAGELPDLDNIVENASSRAGRPYPDVIVSMEPEDIKAWASGYLERLKWRAPGKRHITDKMPANFFYVGLIHAMLPGAKIIHVRRNPVDTCLSCYMQLFSSGNAYTYDLSELGRYYTNYDRLMSHWRNVLPPGSFLEVQYEDVIDDIETQVRRIINYCGLEWNDACLDFHRNKRPVRTASMGQVRQPIYASSKLRWRAYEKHLGPLLAALGELGCS